MTKYITISESEMLEFERDFQPRSTWLPQIEEAWFEATIDSVRQNKIAACVLKKIGDEIFEDISIEQSGETAKQYEHWQNSRGNRQGGSRQTHHHIKNVQEYEGIMQDTEFLMTLAFADFIKLDNTYINGIFDRIY